MFYERAKMYLNFVLTTSLTYQGTNQTDSHPFTKFPGKWKALADESIDKEKCDQKPTLIPRAY